MYNHIRLRKVPKHMKQQKVNIEIINKLLRETITEFPFSLFPYVQGRNSYQAQRDKQGNCVALSMYLQRKLRRRRIQSVIIPATIPQRYQRPEFLTISHVALAIWNGRDQVIICDPSFYFETPMVMDLKKGGVGHIKSRNVYKGKSDVLQFSSFVQEAKTKLNEFQTVPANTYFAETFTEEEPDDSWKYYLIEVLNPDEAISTFYLNIKRYPFIAYIDSSLNMPFYLSFEDSSTLLVKKDNELVFEGHITEVPEMIDHIISSYLTSEWREMMRFPHNLDNKIYFVKDYKPRTKTRSRR